MMMMIMMMMGLGLGLGLGLGPGLALGDPSMVRQVGGHEVAALLVDNIMLPSSAHDHSQGQCSVKLQASFYKGRFVYPLKPFSCLTLCSCTQAHSCLAIMPGFLHHLSVLLHRLSVQAREWYREDLVGNALNASSLTRESVFLTTKIHPRHFGSTVTLDVFANSLVCCTCNYGQGFKAVSAERGQLSWSKASIEIES